MLSLEELAENPDIKNEYKKTVLLSMFKKVCIKMKNDESFEKSIRNLFRESYDKVLTTKIIIERSFDISLSEEESKLLSTWFEANFKKQNKRNPKFTSIEVKKRLFTLQNGMCALCGEELGNEMSKIHVDHIIPFILVGDELKDNYQDLCNICNECKSAKIDFIFKKMINI
ncbi:HNH endonuclease [bacterium]|nr:HNH endonuclease [bacterium]